MRPVRYAVNQNIFVFGISAPRTTNRVLYDSGPDGVFTRPGRRKAIIIGCGGHAAPPTRHGHRLPFRDAAGM